MLDCGANMGFFSALAAHRGCDVYVFEPSRHIRATYLDRNAEMNGVKEVMPYALSDKRETLRFVVNRENIGASMRADEMGDASPGAAAMGDFEDVEAVKLDDIVAEGRIPKVDFIKAGIEGSERHMLCGARGVLRDFAPRLSICTYHLPDDPQVIRDIILDNQPRYKVIQVGYKLYAHVWRVFGNGWPTFCVFGVHCASQNAQEERTNLLRKRLGHSGFKQGRTR